MRPPGHINDAVLTLERCLTESESEEVEATVIRINNHAFCHASNEHVAITQAKAGAVFVGGAKPDRRELNTPYDRLALASRISLPCLSAGHTIAEDWRPSWRLCYSPGSIRHLLRLVASSKGGNMGREERRAERKSRKRRLHWLEGRRKKNERVNEMVSRLEEYFDEDELEDAEAFFVDYFTWSGPFSQFDETIDPERLERICQDYGIDFFDANFIMDIVDEVFLREPGEPTNEH